MRFDLVMRPDADATARYTRDGFLLLKGLIEPEALAALDARFVELVTGAATAPDRMVVMRDVMVAKGAVRPETPLHAVNKILSFEDDAVLFGYSLHADLLAWVRALVGADLVTLSTNVFNKPPGVDGRHPLHQDLRYFSLRPADGIVASWTAISPMTRDNGCLAVVPGSQRRGLLPHGTPDWEFVNGGFFGAEGVDLEQRVHIEMDPGDTLLFHPLLVHGSGRNRSRDFRRAISTHFASAACRRPEGERKRAPVMRRIPGPMG
jgi:phytanoyl-CoA hydroxylase